MKINAHRTVAAMLIGLSCATGCDRASTQVANSSSPPAASQIAGESFYGTYVITDFAIYRGALVETQKWAQQQIGTEVVLERDHCTIMWKKCDRPTFSVTKYDALPEGEVTSGRKRLLSRFWGFDNGLEYSLVLEVRQGQRFIADMEIVSADLIWKMSDGFIFQLQRKGAAKKAPPLSARD